MEFLHVFAVTGSRLSKMVVFNKNGHDVCSRVLPCLTPAAGPQKPHRKGCALKKKVKSSKFICYGDMSHEVVFATRG